MQEERRTIPDFTSLQPMELVPVGTPGPSAPESEYDEPWLSPMDIYEATWHEVLVSSGIPSVLPEAGVSPKPPAPEPVPGPSVSAPASAPTPPTSNVFTFTVASAAFGTQPSAEPETPSYWYLPASINDHNIGRPMPTWVTSGPYSNTYPYFGAPSVESTQPRATDRTYHCICCHVTTCATAIGIIQLVGLIFALIFSITEYMLWPAVPVFQRAMIASIPTSIVGTIILILLFYGVSREKPLFLLPHIAFQILSIAGFSCGIVWYAMAAVGYGSAIKWDDPWEGQNQVVFWSTISVIGICMVALVVQLIFVVQVSKCYRYLRIKTRAW